MADQEMLRDLLARQKKMIKLFGSSKGLKPSFSVFDELSDEAEDKFLAEHWANDLLDAPHALIAMIETKIARAEIQAARHTKERIIKLLEGLAYIDEQGHEMISEFKDDLIRAIGGEQK